MKIAICDDEEICRSHILDIAYDYSEERKDTDVVFRSFRTPDSLLQSISAGEKYDIYILDIVMPDMNGITLGQHIRKKSTDSKIIYLTSSEEYALESFRVRAFDYILKPIGKQDFYRVMDEAINSINIKTEKSIILKTKEGSARVSLHSIMFVEISNRALAYHLLENKTITTTTLRTSFSESIRDLSDDKRFYQCGASTLFNLHHILSVENEGVVFTDNSRIYINKKFSRELRYAWNNYWTTKEG